MWYRHRDPAAAGDAVRRRGPLSNVIRAHVSGSAGEGKGIDVRNAAACPVRRKPVQCPGRGGVPGQVRRSRIEAHAASLGGPRGSVVGSKVSTQIIRPRPQCGQSHSDTPVSRW